MSEKITQQIIEMINTGRLQPGSKLPSERELMDQLKVSRSPIREALRSLKLIGILDTIPGGGTYVSSSLPGSFIQGQLEWSGVLAEPDVLELVEIREPLEIQAAGLAANRATPASVTKLRSIIDQYEANKGNLERLVELDVLFHQTIADMAGNRILIYLMNILRDLWQEYILEQRILFSESSAVQHEYRKILAAIKRGDELKARQAMTEHLRSSKQAALFGKQKSSELIEESQKPSIGSA